MKSPIITLTPTKLITTKEPFASTEIPTNKKFKIHSTLNTIYQYLPKTTLQNNRYYSKTTTSINNNKKVSTKTNE